jgi:hypothetical protein
LLHSWSNALLADRCLESPVRYHELLGEVRRRGYAWREDDLLDVLAEWSILLERVDFSAWAACEYDDTEISQMNALNCQIISRELWSADDQSKGDSEFCLGCQEPWKWAVSRRYWPHIDPRTRSTIASASEKARGNSSTL